MRLNYEKWVFNWHKYIGKMFKQNSHVILKLYKIHNYIAIILPFAVKHSSVSRVIASTCYT